MKSLTLARALALALALAMIPLNTVTAEGPLSGTCDGSGRLVCAGIDVGANVQCDTDLAGNAACSWTYGWISTAYSPLGLPGNEAHSVSATLTVCKPGTACEVTDLAGTDTTCAWFPVSACDDSVGFPADHAYATLGVGDCVSVHVTLTATIDASVVNPDLTLATVSFSNSGGDAGIACIQNNGR